MNIFSSLNFETLLNQHYYSTFIHCKNFDFLIGWLVPRNTGLWQNNLLTSLLRCNTRGINSNSHHGHYNMASADSKFEGLLVFLCAAYSIGIIKILTHLLLVNYRDMPALVQYEWTRNFQYSIKISRSLLVNECSYIPIIHSLSALTCN